MKTPANLVAKVILTCAAVMVTGVPLPAAAEEAAAPSTVQQLAGVANDERTQRLMMQLGELQTQAPAVYSDLTPVVEELSKTETGQAPYSDALEAMHAAPLHLIGTPIEQAWLQRFDEFRSSPDYVAHLDATIAILRADPAMDTAMAELLLPGGEFVELIVRQGAAAAAEYVAFQAKLIVNLGAIAGAALLIVGAFTTCNGFGGPVAGALCAATAAAMSAEFVRQRVTTLLNDTIAYAQTIQRRALSIQNDVINLAFTIQGEALLCYAYTSYTAENPNAAPFAVYYCSNVG